MNNFRTSIQDSLSKVFFVAMIYFGICQEGRTQSCITPGTPGAPSLSNVTTTSLTVSWGLVANANAYRVYYSYNLGLYQLNAEYNGSTTSTILTSLNPAGYYRVYIQAVRHCIDGEGFPETLFSSSPVSATTLIPATPTLNEGACVSPDINSITFVWNTVTCDGYFFDVSASSAFSSYVQQNKYISGSATSSYVQTGLDPGTNYYYQVRAYSGATSDYSPRSGPIPTRPVAPVLDVPTNMTTSSFQIHWHSSNGNATSYRLDVSALSDFSSLLTGYSDLQVGPTSQSVSGLLPGHTYYYRVRALTARDISTNTQGSMITVPDGPVILPASEPTETAFTANWEAATGASGYRLDVSTDNNFSSLLAMYSDMPVSGTSISITGLVPGTTYYYRVRATNSSGVSVNSNQVAIITLPPSPVATAASNISTTEFVAHWEPAAGADSYRIDVSSTDDFSSLLPGFDNLQVNNTSQTVSGLTPGVTYYYRVRAVNTSGISDNSNLIAIKTLSPAPMAMQAIPIGATSFTANWESATGAESYQLDVANSNTFSANSLLENYVGKEVNGTSLTVDIGIVPGTSYYYRVRAVNSSGVSAYSSTIEVLTLPDAPVLSIVTQQQNNITLSWESIPSAIGYELEASTTSTFESLVDNYNPKTVVGFTSQVVDGLDAATIYYFRIRTQNATGFSDFSEAKAAATLDKDGNNVIPPLKLIDIQFPETHIAGSSATMSINSEGGVGTPEVTFFHRKKSESTFTAESVALGQENTYTLHLEESWFDVFGMEFYIESSDLSGQVAREPSSSHEVHSIIIAVPSFTIPIEVFGTDLIDYSIISFPYATTKSKIEDLFVPIMGEYDRSLWRFVRYENGALRDYLKEELRIDDVAQGNAYWFISKNPVQLTFANARNYDCSIASPFVLSLKRGWNQIGNPFPVDISWTMVLDANASADIDNSYYEFVPGTLSFASTTNMKAFGGGFIFANTDTQLTFPIALTSAATGSEGGRLGSANIQPSSSEDDWLLSLKLTQGQVVNNLVGIGMNMNATDGKDSYDKVTIPRFFRYLELNSRVSNYEFDICQNIVKPQDHFQWSFRIESNSTEPIELSWDKDQVAKLKGQLLLYDKTRQILVDMSAMASYVASPDDHLIFFYNHDKPNDLDAAVQDVLQPYPNPFSAELTIPIVATSAEDLTVDLSIYDLSGRILYTQVWSPKEHSPGVHFLTWDGMTNLGQAVLPGSYLYRVRVSQAGSLSTTRGKLIKQ